MRIDVKPFSDVRVRQAFRLIVDRQQMIDQAYSGFGWLGNDMYAPFDPGYPGTCRSARRTSSRRSRCSRRPATRDLTVELDTSDAVGGGAVAAAQVFAEQAKGAGVKVNVKKVDAGVFYGEDYLSWTVRPGLLVHAQLPRAGRVRLDARGAVQRDALGERRVAGARRRGVPTVDEAKRNELIGQAAGRSSSTKAATSSGPSTTRSTRTATRSPGFGPTSRGSRSASSPSRSLLRVSPA